MKKIVDLFSEGAVIMGKDVTRVAFSQKGASELFFDNLVNKKRLAQALGVSTSFIDKLMALDGLPHFKVGRAVRFRVSDVVVWLHRRRRP